MQDDEGKKDGYKGKKNRLLKFSFDYFNDVDHESDI